MSCLGALVLAAAAVARPAGSPAPPGGSPAPPAALLRLRGLDRLHFTHGGSSVELTAPPLVTSLLARSLGAAPRATPTRTDSAFEQPAIAGTDFVVPLTGWPRKVALRQVVDSSHPRIHQLWL